MFAFAAAFALAIASFFGAVAPAPVEASPFAGMTAAECGELPDYKSTHDCVMALWDMGTLDLEACGWEDSADCVWISRGGSDFIDVNGYAYYLPIVLTA